MLKKFEVIGFKNFDFPLVLDFSDVKQYNFNKECIKDGILKTVVVYGKNSVGKSNFGLALFDIVKNVTDFEFPNEHYAQNYAYVGTANQATEFAYYFNFDGKKISYKYKKQGFQSYIYEEIIINNLS